MRSGSTEKVFKELMHNIYCFIGLKYLRELDYKVKLCISVQQAVGKIIFHLNNFLREIGCNCNIPTISN